MNDGTREIQPFITPFVEMAAMDSVVSVTVAPARAKIRKVFKMPTFRANWVREGLVGVRVISCRVFKVLGF
jgi:hypothetical protein